MNTVNIKNTLRGTAAVEQPLKIAKARETLLNKGALNDNAVRPVIQASWQRCLKEDVNPLVASNRLEVEGSQLSSLSDQHEALISAAKPIINDAKDLLTDSGTIMHLVAPSGIILCSQGDEHTRALANDYRLMPGANWNERVAGTNAIGTALNTGLAIQVHAYEHFCENINDWTCSAAVIRDPFEHSILGAVNISGLKDTLHDYCLALAVSGAHQIEGQLAQHRLAKRDLLLSLTLERFNTPSNDGLLLLDNRGHVIRNNHQADRVLAARGLNIDLTPFNPIQRLNQKGTFSAQATSIINQLQPQWLQPIHYQDKQIGILAVVPFPTRQPSAIHHAANQSEPIHEPGFSRLVGRNALFLKLIQQASRLAKAPIPVLLQGETGVGKELFAHAMHEVSPANNKAFIALNCGSLSKDLLASELFGYIEGAFTGARRGGMIGKIEAANGGTLFLDEIGEMPLDLQPLFLRVLQESEICRVGETQPRKVNFRLIAATNRDLAEEVAQGRFRMDLYYRISSMTLTIPPLRERHEDIVQLAEHMLEELTQRYGGIKKQLSHALKLQLEHHSWPGNIRELSNLITAAYFLTDAAELTPEDLPTPLQNSSAVISHGHQTIETDTPLQHAEREVICRTLQQQGGNLTRTAKALNIAKSTLYIKLQKYGIDRTT
ncbi:sigma-54-dependent Fis family transcriptional regulator [Amphritea sp. 1_MG-2023]|uniref:sigma-54-dependent Fis family transcriptional regulator n=1 Tax=Amphritea sp. 1_MG-2023 TaxID=3062670 RepID=UPI0026E45849|nr:sigma-54-dependent Fis family transcriptional regulator [Amphritea sp. 1_MG-2023]MDO6562406.1 sigma-54-dependent Fis family transcriptional regulator [Amphritea sp. 1_MG-2023]